MNDAARLLRHAGIFEVGLWSALDSIFRLIGMCKGGNSCETPSCERAPWVKGGNKSRTNVILGPALFDHTIP